MENFVKFFKPEMAGEYAGAEPSRYLVIWNSLDYNINDNGDVDVSKYHEVRDFVFNKLLPDMSIKDMIIDSGEDSECITKGEIVGFEVMASFCGTSLYSEEDEIILSIIYRYNGSYESCCGIILDSKYAGYIAYEARKFRSKVKS